MNALLSIPIWLAAITFTVLIFCGGLFLWQTRIRSQKIMLSDQETVWLLVGLLVIAVVCFVVFLLVVL